MTQAVRQNVKKIALLRATNGNSCSLVLIFFRFWKISLLFKDREGGEHVFAVIKLRLQPWNIFNERHSHQFCTSMVLALIYNQFLQVMVF